MTRWLIAGGGTGGHVTMALGLAEELRERGAKVLLLGTDRGLEQQLVPAAGFELICLPARQVMGQRVVAAARALFGLLGTTRRARGILREHAIGIVISVGGYAAVPAVLAARTLGVPSVVIEPNAIPGRANRLLARFASLVFLGFESARSRLPAAERRGVVGCVGVPLQRKTVQRFSASVSRTSAGEKLRLLVVGGSQGARQLNEAMIEALPLLDAQRFEIFHQSGTADEGRVRDAYERAGMTAEVVAFSHELPERYAWAQLALCRAGALSVAELCLAGLPSLLVPYPYAADNHQAANAEELVRSGAARVLDSSALSGADVVKAIDLVLSEPGRLEAMADVARALARPAAAQDIIAACEPLLAGERNSS